MKPIYRQFALIITSCSLFACTSIPTEQVNSRLSDWKGKNIDEVIKYWGLPTKQHQVGDKHYAEWLNKSSEPGNASVSLGTGHHGRSGGIGIGLTLFDFGSTDNACSRLLTYDGSGKVTQITWQGTNDYCYELTPDLAKVKSNQVSTAN